MTRTASVPRLLQGGFVLDDGRAAAALAKTRVDLCIRGVLVLALALATAACAPAGAVDTAQLAPCSQRVQTRLFFGLDMPGGRVTDVAWLAFVDDVATPRFGEGLTVFEARGHWRDASGATTKESSRIVEVVHADSAAHRRHLTEIVDTYKRRFGSRRCC